NQMSSSVTLNADFSSAVAFRQLKVLLLFYQALQSWRDLSVNNNTLSLFDIKLVKEVVSLNLPRIFAIPLQISSTQNLNCNIAGGGQIQNFNELSNYDPQKITFVVISTDFELNFGGGIKYPSESVLTKLATIGPIARPENEINLLKERLREILVAPNTIVFLEDGVLEDNALWAEIFGELVIENSKLPVVDIFRTDFPLIEFSEVKKVVEGYQNIDIGRSAPYVSATRLQIYLDCPMKFYLRYIKKMEPEFNIESSLFVRELGQLEHLAIQKYFSACSNNYSRYEPQQHRLLCEQILEEFCGANQRKLDPLNKKIFCSELRRFSEQAIIYLLKIKQDNPKLKFYFEKELSGVSLVEGFTVKGRIDLLINDPERGWAMIDFKRSDASIPSRKAIEKMEKIQMWFYLNHSEIAVDDIYQCGFLNLKRFKRSLFFEDEYMSFFRKNLARFQELKKKPLYLYLRIKIILLNREVWMYVMIV
ncbi:MAG: PD-(D/E)XK nuclease family protein, partial [Oligoflexia bacterium]|nr:PD-(D/E)XK nuclease family protein [Oligoflexia bacterium]